MGTPFGLESGNWKCPAGKFYRGTKDRQESEVSREMLTE